eukprot:114062-Amphidinium_carterae.3
MAGKTTGVTLMPACSLATRRLMVLLKPLMEELTVSSELLRPTSDIDDVEFSVAGAKEEVVMTVTTEAVRKSMGGSTLTPSPWVSKNVCCSQTWAWNSCEIEQVGGKGFRLLDMAKYLGTQAKDSNRTRTQVLQMRLKRAQKRYAQLHRTVSKHNRPEILMQVHTASHGIDLQLLVTSSSTTSCAVAAPSSKPTRPVD